jgi:ABC-type antimicrobial peptide transport system permease subunit
VSEYMARKHWPDKDAVGQRLTLDDPSRNPAWYTVVGVASSVHQTSLTGPDDEQMYFPSVDPVTSLPGGDGNGSVFVPPSMSLVIRAQGPGAALAPSLEQTVRDLDRDALVSQLFTLRDAIADQFTEPRFYLIILSAFAAAALTLAVIGIYGVISYAVARRQHEIGVRLALGAERGTVFRLVVGQGMQLAAYGGAVGLLLALLFTRYLRAMLFGIRPDDPVTFALVIGVLALSAFAACGIPARRATRIDPARALRCE